ncbi:uncharacterized protein C2845_PM07G36050 [Panicum miliaceum]|uniref:Uncharacterized protein n=1 Tax=Panicum miliaceum TaxID=4540 RepID=A0A3L6SJT2_PANMI|nr:uncharacterized protein C2845_PM07G36050 [Panicum miliaceum]
MTLLEVAELVLLAAAASALAAALILFCQSRRESRKRPPPELPLSQEPTAAVVLTKASRSRQLLVLILLTMLCFCSCSEGRQSARVEPASQAQSSSREERWLGPASRALYTIDEDDEPQDETPFYTPAASPARLLM